MKKILQIFSSDVRAIFKNKITLTLICGLLILPSFYAWFNIYASWDPYGNTDGIKVAVCNTDLGATLLGETVNVGKDLLENLKDEDTLGWFFVDDEAEAIELTRTGEAYASIVIPEDFSAKMVTVLDENPMKPSLEYYVNEKINAIAPKVTDKGVSTLQTEIGNTFIESLTEEIYSTLEELDLTTEDITETFDSYQEYLDDFIGEIPITIERLNTTADTIKSGSNLVSLSAGDVGLVSNIFDDSISFTQDIKTDVDKLNEDTDEFSNDLVETLKLTRTSFQDLDNNTVDLREEILLEKPEAVARLKGSSADLKLVIGDIRDIQNSLDEFDDEIFTEVDALNEIVDNRLAGLEYLIDDITGFDLNGDKINFAISSVISLNTDLIASLLSLSDQLEAVNDSSLLSAGAATIKEKIEEAVVGLKALNTTYNSILETIKQIDEFGEDIEGYLVSSRADIEETRDHFDEINNLLEDEKNYLTPFVNNSVDVTLARIDTISDDLKDLAADINDRDNAEITLDNIHNLNLNIIDNLDSLINRIETDFSTSAKKYLSGISDFSADLNLLLVNINKKTPLVEEFLYKIAKNGEDAATDMTKLSENLPDLQEDLTKVSDRLDEFDEKVDIERFSNLLIANKDIVSDFMANPVELDTHALYSAEYYGISMTPFYTTLCLWVGILVLAGLLTTKSKNVDFEISPLENFLGKYLFFASLAVTQGLIVSLGDLFLLDVPAASPVLFVALTMFQSLVFCTIIYTLICLFGNIGKALGVIFLVLQVAGAGGTFPIQMNPAFFQKLYEWLPFTYGIGALREAIFGVYYPALVKDVSLLIIYLMVFLATGILLIGRAHKYIGYMAEEFEESGLSE